MKSLFLLPIFALAAACGGTRSTTEAETSAAATPRFGRMTAMWEVVDRQTGERIGFVERTEYDDMRVLYWVTGLNRDLRRGFITADGKVYKYVWRSGQRDEEPQFLGMDVRDIGARHILGYDDLVALQPITLQQLMKELEPKQDSAPAAAGEGDEPEEE